MNLCFPPVAITVYPLNEFSDENIPSVKITSSNSRGNSPTPKPLPLENLEEVFPHFDLHTFPMNRNNCILS